MIEMDRTLKLGFSRELVAEALKSDQFKSKYFYWVDVDPNVANDLYTHETGKAVGSIYRRYARIKHWTNLQMNGNVLAPEEIFDSE